MSAPTPPVKYRKLTRLKRMPGTFSRLWIGSDHLLHVTSTGYTETYRRYFLRDIQGIMLEKTAGRVWVAVAIGVLGLIAGSIAAAISATAVWVMLALTAAGLLWNHLLGPGCCGVIITAVQYDKVPSLARVPSARRIINELRPLILAAQAGLPPAAAGEAKHDTAPPLPVPPAQGAAEPPLLG